MIKIKELRKSAGISQESLANQLGVTQATLSGWETGKYEPDLKSLKRIAIFFNVSIDYILDQPNSHFSSNKSFVPLKESIVQYTPEETEIIELYRSLDLKGKTNVAQIIFDESERIKEKNNDSLENKKNTQDNKREFVDFDEKVRYIGSDDTIRYAAYGGGVGSDDNTVKHN